MRKNILLVALVTLCMNSQANSGDVYSSEYLTIDTVELVEIIETDGEKQEVPADIANAFNTVNTVAGGGGQIGAVIAIANQLVALGEKTYTLVKKGEAVVQTESAPISVLPMDKATKTPVSVLDMGGFSAPKTKTYGIRAKNLFGMTTVKFDFMLIFSHGGSYEGKGKYISGAQVIPLLAEATYGYTLDAKFSLQSIMNNGTKDQPVAGAILVMKYTMGTMLKKTQESRTFYINGNGQAKAYQGQLTN